MYATTAVSYPITMNCPFCGISYWKMEDFRLLTDRQAARHAIYSAHVHETSKIRALLT